MLADGVRLATERMPHVRSVSVGIWIGAVRAGNREENAGISHFIEHMLFKGTRDANGRSHRALVDSIGGNLDAFTAKEFVGDYPKVLDQHLPQAFEVLADSICIPSSTMRISSRSRRSSSRDQDGGGQPDYMVHEIFSEGFWKDHPLGKPILGPRRLWRSITTRCRPTSPTSTSRRISWWWRSAISSLNVGSLLERALADSPQTASPARSVAADGARISVQARKKELEQVHLVCTEALPQHLRSALPATCSIPCSAAE